MQINLYDSPIAASPMNKEAGVSLKDIERVSNMWIWGARFVLKKKCSSEGSIVTNFTRRVSLLSSKIFITADPVSARQTSGG